MRQEATSTATRLETHARSAVLAAPGRIQLKTAGLPEPGPGQVRVRLEGCGVCASNLAPWAGAPWFEYPFPDGAPGHEGWGLVDRIGSGVTGIEEGDRVATIANGAFATHLVLDAVDVVPIPTVLRDIPLPGEPLGCVMNILRRSAVEPGQTVAIVGTGFLGLLLTQLAARTGAKVIAISRRPSALALAERMGAARTIPMDDHTGIIEEVKECTRGAMCDRVIEAVGKQWPLDLAGELTREGGRLIVAGYHQDGPRQVNMQLWNWRGIDVINAHERDVEVVRRGVREAVQAMAEGRLDPSPLYTHWFLLERLGEALDAARDRPEGFIKALITIA
ncbi:MAG TPA: zinc-binding dehydrogenase [Longimicrobiaceae bacterium]